MLVVEGESLLCFLFIVFNEDRKIDGLDTDHAFGLFIAENNLHYICVHTTITYVCPHTSRYMCSAVLPAVVRTPTSADALQPSVDFAEVVLHRVVGLAFETEVLVQLNTPIPMPRPDSLAQLWSAGKVHFDVCEIVGLGLASLVIVDAGNEDEIASLEFQHCFHAHRQRVELVRLYIGEK